MSEKIGRNDPCWCGSGRKYKKCHLGRANEPKLPSAALQHMIQQEFGVKECLHPLASPTTCGKVIAAHTIQRAGAIRSLADATNHVRTFYPLRLDDEGMPILHKRGVHRASTFAGFCERHDGETFAAIERMPFIGTAEQCFLIAYRALCHELYQKAASLRSQPVLRDFGDKGEPVDEQRRRQHRFAVIHAGVQHGLQDAHNKKFLMDQHLLSGDFTDWRRFIIRFKGDICVASTGAPTPTYDLVGKELQVLHDPNIAIQHLFYGVVPIQDGGAVVFSWLSVDRACSRFISSLEKLPKKLLPSILIQFMFAHVENTFFSEAWWSSLNDVQRTHVKQLAMMANPYYEEIECLSDALVPWRITSLERV